jgi:hypothetical protein
MQISGEAIFQYFAWNIETFKRFMASQPDETLQATQADTTFKLIYDNSLTNTRPFFQNQVFIASLHKPIHNEIPKCTYTNFQAIYEAALDLEIIQQDKKAAKPVTVADVGENSPSPSVSCKLGDDKIEAINVVRALEGQAQFFEWRRHIQPLWTPKGPK